MQPSYGCPPFHAHSSFLQLVLLCTFHTFHTCAAASTPMACSTTTRMRTGSASSTGVTRLAARPARLTSQWMAQVWVRECRCLNCGWRKPGLRKCGAFDFV
eukprot:364464-Chlamydomonas_euryale.AAC.4